MNGLTVSGTGFIDTPYVQVTGGDGTGASAVAVIDYTTGNLTGIRLTNPGTGYTIAPTFTLVGGGLVRHGHDYRRRDLGRQQQRRAHEAGHRQVGTIWQQQLYRRDIC